MATTTPNFGWSVPTSTDLVKDGATAIETLGDAIDASLVDLKGGTTGQVLSKNSNTDMDFTWVADASGIPATIFDAKGDIIAASAADTAARLAVGTNGQVLKANSATATGLEWGSAAAPLVWSLVSTTSMSGSSTVTLSGLNYKNLRLFIDNAKSATSNVTFIVRPNGNTTDYANSYQVIGSPASYSSMSIYGTYSNLGGIQLSSTGSSTATTVSGYVNFSSADQTTGFKPYESAGYPAYLASATDRIMYAQAGLFTATVAITSIDVLAGGGTFNAGTLRLYGAN